ncbi:hypothetical protein ACPOL_2994 [Acidisarcina polymorpha]|uniref:Uncharacterized protein n=1 Tax=Acidisarcina polymorpha TaxID=2211140 RepID=A0A2Z5G130_9BACT|nr:hypothetical protein ACPOL_2994 [Acidisarcina polymorpha]
MMNVVILTSVEEIASMPDWRCGEISDSLKSHELGYLQYSKS